MNKNSTISLDIHRARMLSILASSIFFFVSALYLWRQQNIDVSMVLMHNDVFENHILFNFFQLVSRFGMGFISLVYCLLTLLSFKNDDLASNRPIFLYLVFAFAFGSVFGDLLKEVLERARPAVQLAGQITNSTLSTGGFSFPSGHATKSMSLALPFVLMASNGNIINRIVKILVLLASALVCYSRIALQRHFPSDVLAGIAVALFAVVVGRWIANVVYRRRNIDDDKLEGWSVRLCFAFGALAILLTMI